MAKKSQPQPHRVNGPLLLKVHSHSAAGQWFFCHNKGKVWQQLQQSNAMLMQNIRGFPKVDHSGRSARIVLEQINSAKKLPLTGLEPSTLRRSVLLTSCLSCLTSVLDPIA